jgi:hypothetical protein
MIGVSGGMVATLGMLQPDINTLIQMGGCVGTGMGIGLIIAKQIKVCSFKLTQIRIDDCLGDGFAAIGCFIS